MKHLFTIAAIALLAFNFTSCKKSDNSVSGRMAQTICDCSAKKEINELNRKMEKEADLGKKAQFMADIAKKAIEAEVCKTSALKELKSVPADKVAETLVEYKQKVDKGCPGFYEELQ